MIRRGIVSAGVAVALLACSSVPALAAETIPAAVTAALTDAARPDADRQRDADRKPAELITFSGMKPGDKVIELLPGRGYFTRLFSKVVGPKGSVHALVPPRPANAPANAPDMGAAVRAIAGDAQFSNVRVGDMDPAAMAKLEKADIVWTSLNYHDLHNRPNADLAAFNKANFDALKPGGVYIVIDHSAAKGTGKSGTQSLHRIEPDFVKSEVTAAGFVFEAESQALRNPADPLTVPNREGAVQGKTDQFVFRFRKPK